MPKEFYTVEEIANLLRLDERVVLDYIKSGELAAINVGRGKQARYRIGQSDIDIFVERRRVKPESQEDKPTRSETDQTTE